MKTFIIKPTKFFIIAAVIAAAAVSCGTSDKVALAQNNSGEKNNLLRGIVVFKNKETLEGYVAVPRVGAKTLWAAKPGAEAFTKYKADEIEYTIIWSASAPERKHKFVPTQLYTNKMFSTKMELSKDIFWIVVTAESPKLTSYIGAQEYGINKKGDLIFSSTSNVGTVSFPIYMKKSGDAAPKFVALKKGIINEAASFRAGVTNFLADDPDLCEYIKVKKLGTDDVEEIVKRYNPQK